MTALYKKHIIRFIIILGFGIIPALIVQFFAAKPITRNIHIRSFRYGKDPSVIRCNRGDTLRLTFSTDDTGHSFFLEEFDMDAKVSPARETVEVFKTSDPTQKPDLTKEVVLIARHSGWQNFLVSRSNYRCHVWCGPMHAFEHGKLIILPNTLLIFSLGSITGIFVLWIFSFFYSKEPEFVQLNKEGYVDILKKFPLLKKLVISRWPQLLLLVLTMILMYVVILTTFFGTKMSGRNLGVLLMWGVWLFILVALMTPFLGRFWCTICPLPTLGDWVQRKSLITPVEGTTGIYRNKFSGLFLKWPKRLSNDWPKLIVLLALTTFSTTLVALPKVTGWAVIFLIAMPFLLSMVFELRAFCRYLCPVSGFLAPFSRMSSLAIRNKSQKTCDKCTAHYCEKGSSKGWACPYGINVGELSENSECGMCLECTRSCLYKNVTVYSRPFASELGTKNSGQAWLTIGVFTLAIVYSVLYQGHWPVVRDFVNILDKGNWGLFGWYVLIVWTTALFIMPGIFYLLAFAGVRISGIQKKTKEVFLNHSGSLLPLGLMLWIAFVIPMLFVNLTFVLQSLSDPFGWGWDFFGTANIPWHQFLPRLMPWLQAVLILVGFQLSLRNLRRSWIQKNFKIKSKFLVTMPMSLFLLAFTIALIYFFTN